MWPEAACDGFGAGPEIHTFPPDIALRGLMIPAIKGTEACHPIKEIPAQANVRMIAMGISEHDKRSVTTRRPCTSIWN